MRAAYEHLNVGCGPLPRIGFCNLDYDWAPGRPGQLCWDVSRGIPLPSRSLAGIYSEHCLEHIAYSACEGALRDFNRLLKPGGVVRIVVPDGEFYCRLYCRATAGEPVEFPYPEGGNSPMWYVNRIMRNHGHEFIYDFETLRALLRSAGFRTIERVDFRRGRDPMLLVDQEHRRIESLYVEAYV